MPTALHATAALSLAYCGVFLVLSVGVYVDASTRGDKALPHALATLVLGWPALALYLAARRPVAVPCPVLPRIEPGAALSRA